MITYPVSGGRVVNVVPFYTDPSKVDTPFTGSQIGQGTAEEVLKIFEGWEPEVQAVLKVRLSAQSIDCLLTQFAVHGQAFSLGNFDAEAIRDVGRRRCLPSRGRGASLS